MWRAHNYVAVLKLFQKQCGCNIKRKPFIHPFEIIKITFLCRVAHHKYFLILRCDDNLGNQMTFAI